MRVPILIYYKWNPNLNLTHSIDKAYLFILLKSRIDSPANLHPADNGNNCLY